MADPQRIVLATDFSDDADEAVLYAVALAQRHAATLDVLHVLAGHCDHLRDVEDSPTFRAHLDALEREACSRLKAVASGTTNLDVRCHISWASSAAAGIVSLADRERADLIIMATRGRHALAQRFLGSVAQTVIGEASCPVLCVKRGDEGMLRRANGTIQIDRILVPTDFSEPSRRALLTAVPLAKAYDAEIHVFFGIPFEAPPMIFAPGVKSVLELDEGILARLRERLAEFVACAEDADVRVMTETWEGAPAKAIVEYARSHRIDLIVMSKTGVGETPQLLGSMPQRLLHDSHCPLLVLGRRRSGEATQSSSRGVRLGG